MKHLFMDYVKEIALNLNGRYSEIVIPVEKIRNLHLYDIVQEHSLQPGLPEGNTQLFQRNVVYNMQLEIEYDKEIEHKLRRTSIFNGMFINTNTNDEIFYEFNTTKEARILKAVWDDPRTYSLLQLPINNDEDIIRDTPSLFLEVVSNKHQ